MRCGLHLSLSLSATQNIENLCQQPSLASSAHQHASSRRPLLRKAQAVLEARHARKVPLIEVSGFSAADDSVLVQPVHSRGLFCG